jgi:hypothetical protein
MTVNPHVESGGCRAGASTVDTATNRTGPSRPAA